MTREGIEKLNGNPKWAEAYHGALAAHQAAGHGVPYAVALAEQDADAALAEADATQATAIAGARARLAARGAEDREQAKASAQPEEAAQAALARAVASINANRGVTHAEGEDTAMAQRPPQGDGKDQQRAGAPVDMSPAAKAVAAINARR